jgi:micrococcal nuclease
MRRRKSIPKKTRRARRKGPPFAQFFALLAVVSIAWITADKAPHAFPPAKTYEGVIVRIVDGDTFYMDGVETRIRIWGLDAPEKSERGGHRATRMLREIAHGERVSCREVDTDRYGRIVGQCFLEDGRDVAALMIASGTASEYLHYSGGYYSRTTVASSD